MQKITYCSADEYSIGFEINSTLKTQTNIPFGHKISLEDIKGILFISMNYWYCF